MASDISLLSSMGLLLAAIVALGFGVALEFTWPMPAVSNHLAGDLAPRLGVSESLLRQELTVALLKSEHRLAPVRVLPLCVVIVLLAARLILDLAAGRSVYRRPGDGGLK